MNEYIDALFIVCEKNIGISADAPAAISADSLFFDNLFANMNTINIIEVANRLGIIFNVNIGCSIIENNVKM